MSSFILSKITREQKEKLLQLYKQGLLHLYF